MDTKPGHPSSGQLVEAPSSSEDPSVLLAWSARKIHPRVLAYVALVFVAFMLFAHFVVHSPDAVFALAAAAVGSVVPLLPGVLNRTEFQFTEGGLRRKTRKEQKREGGTYEEVFSWEELGHVVPQKHGFKFFKAFQSSGWFDAFWKLHISDRWSGEFQVEMEDQPRVREVLSSQSIPMGDPKKLP